MVLGSFIKLRYDHYKTQLYHARITHPKGSHEDDFAYMGLNSNPHDLLLEGLICVLCPFVGLFEFIRDLVLFPKKSIVRRVISQHKNDFLFS